MDVCTQVPASRLPVKDIFALNNLRVRRYEMKKNDQNDHAFPLLGAPIQKLLVPPIVENTELTGELPC